MAAKNQNCDVVIVGGGMAGAVLARRLAQYVGVLVVEREQIFKDRVRGENLVSWGVAEARRLGIYETLLKDANAHEVPGWSMSIGSTSLAKRDLVATTPQRTPCLGFYHPAMQEALLASAERTGAQVMRGASVRGIAMRACPTVTIEIDGKMSETEARLVVGADGRSSIVRRFAGFELRRDPQHLRIAGVLLHAPEAPQDACEIVLNPAMGRAAYLFPQGGGRVRAYNVYQHDSSPSFSGEGATARFITDAEQIGIQRRFLAGVRPGGPVAIFDAANRWVDHPYREGVALIGDAAAASDPSWGQGMSLALRDARVLGDALLADNDWEAAGHAYAREHDQYYAVVRTVDNLNARLFLRHGPAGDAHRAKIFPTIAKDPGLVQFHGPDFPPSEEAIQLLSGEG
jgi:2-polyprenyl-6-methoxyphenol hydroxylase-like FAD-dependent oxidoreductase